MDMDLPLGYFSVVGAWCTPFHVSVLLVDCARVLPGHVWEIGARVGRGTKHGKLASLRCDCKAVRKWTICGQPSVAYQMNGFEPSSRLLAKTQFSNKQLSAMNDPTQL